MTAGRQRGWESEGWETEKRWQRKKGRRWEMRSGKGGDGKKKIMTPIDFDGSATDPSKHI